MFSGWYVVVVLNAFFVTFLGVFVVFYSCVFDLFWFVIGGFLLYF